jgi:hypothetical protein
MITSEDDLLDEFKEFVVLNYEHLRREFLKETNLSFEPLLKIRGYFGDMKQAKLKCEELEKLYGKTFTVCPTTGAWVPMTNKQIIFEDQQLLNETMNTILGHRLRYELEKEEKNLKARDIVIEHSRRTGIIKRSEDEFKIIDGKKMRKKRDLTTEEKMSDA